MEIDQDDILTIDDQKHQSDAFISKTHEDIIKRFKNLEKIYDAQQESTTKSHLVQDLVEDFCSLANKMEDTELALQQIDILKEYHSRHTEMFHNLFGDDFIYRMRSRIDVKSSLNAKEISDPEPEIPDDLEISNDSDSLKISLLKESQDFVRPLYDSKEIQTDIKGVLTELSTQPGFMQKRPSRIVKTVRKDASKSLVEAFKKTKKEKEKLEQTLIKESKEKTTANSLIQLSMKYVEKQLNGYRNYFLASESKETTPVRHNNVGSEIADNSAEDIALKIQREAIASASASKLEKQNMLQKLVKDFSSKDNLKKKKTKKKRIVTKIKMIKSISQTPRGFGPKDFLSRPESSHVREKSLFTTLGLPPLSQSKSHNMIKESPSMEDLPESSFNKSPDKKTIPSKASNHSPHKPGRAEPSLNDTSRTTRSKRKNKVIKRFIKKVKTRS